MNEWLVAAAVIVVGLVPCLALCALGKPLDGLIGLEVGGILTCTVLMLLAEGFHRQSFIDLAVVFAVLNFGGGLAFARILERPL
jgi:multicomponent Na+:H+ antiporter subunit F